MYNDQETGNLGFDCFSCIPDIRMGQKKSVPKRFLGLIFELSRIPQAISEKNVQ